MLRLILLFSLMTVLGCKDPYEMLTDDEKAAAMGEDVKKDGNSTTPPPTSNVSDIPAIVKDKTQALNENPNLVPVNNGHMLNAQDPFSIMAQAYASMPAKITLLNFQNEMKLVQANNPNGSPPTFEQFEQKRKELGITLRSHKPWELYVYDAQNQDIVLMEDPQKKQQMQSSPQGSGHSQ